MTDTTSIHEVLTWHAGRYPLWQAQDIYKLIHQATLGSEHAVPSREAAQSALERELMGLTSGYSEPLIEPIHAEGKIARLHLRTLLHQKRSPLVVLNAFLLTAEEYMGSPALLEEYAAQALHWAQSGGQGIDPQALEKFFKRMRESEYPAVHHSEVYNREYSPAYRVVAVQFLPSTWVRF